jgi:hypothetical protein
MSICETAITLTELGEIRQAEAVVVRQYEFDDGRLEGKIVFIGSKSSADDFADTPRLFLGVLGRKAIYEEAVLVADLLGPEDSP